jgi:hypothetical protein
MVVYYLRDFHIIIIEIKMENEKIHTFKNQIINLFFFYLHLFIIIKCFTILFLTKVNQYAFFTSRFAST